MVKKLRGKAQAKASARTKPRQQPAADPQEEELLRKATIHLITKHGGLLVATDVREERSGEGPPRWVIAFVLRYPLGHEGYVGDLLYDGKEFTFLTPPEVIEQRVKEIAADPERQRQWDAYRASTPPPGKG